MRIKTHFFQCSYERRKQFGESWKDKIQNDLTTMFLTRFDKEKPLWLNGFDLKDLKNREGFGEGREPLPELQGEFGGNATPADGPRQKIPYIFSSDHVRGQGAEVGAMGICDQREAETRGPPEAP